MRNVIVTDHEGLDRLCGYSWKLLSVARISDKWGDSDAFGCLFLTLALRFNRSDIKMVLGI